MKALMRLFVLLLLTTASVYVKAQERKTISGVVQDSAGRGIPDVSVIVKGAKTGSVTDGQGNFKIAVSASGSALQISSVGYATQDVQIGNNTFITITLQSTNNALGDVVVTGFGTRTNTRKLSYSVTQVAGSELTKANNANFVDALQGKVAGVYIAH